MGVASKPSASPPSTSSQTFASFPAFDPQFAAAPGGISTEDAIQSWWGQVTLQLLQLQNTNQQGIAASMASAQASTGTLQAQITAEATTRADADTALADTITTVEASLSTDINSVAASVVTEATARADADGFLSGKFTLTVTAGNVVTGMNITSSTGTGTNISNVTFQAGSFQIFDGSSTSYPVFSVSAGIVQLAGTLTVNTSGKVFIGTGTYNNTNTQFYVDSTGKLSLGTKLTWDGTTLTVTGNINVTAISGLNYAGSPAAGGAANTIVSQGTLATLNSASYTTQVTGTPVSGITGAITVSPTPSGAGLYLGSTNMGYYSGSAWTTYMDNSGHFYLGGTSGSLTWNGTTLTISGTVTATAGTIGGWTIGSTTISQNNAILDSAGQLVLGTVNNVVYLSAIDATYRIWVGNATASSATFSVTKAGALFSSSGMIGGFTIGTTALSAGSGTDAIKLDSGGGAITVGVPSSVVSTNLNNAGLLIEYASGVNATNLSAGGLSLTNTSGTTTADIGTNISMLAGSLTTLAYNFISDNHTGLYLSSTGTLAVACSFGLTAFQVATFTVNNFSFNTTLQAVDTADHAHAILCGAAAGSAQSNYALSVIHRTNSTTKYGLFVGTNWSATENKVFTAAGVDATTGAVTEFFSVHGDGTSQFSSGSASVPTVTFLSDTLTGLYLAGTSDLGITVAGTRYMGMHSNKVVCYQRLQMADAYAASATAATGSIPILDDTGTTYYARVSTTP